MSVEIILDYLPQELVYIIFGYLNTESIKKLGNSSPIMWEIKFKYDKDVRSGKINPFIETSVDENMKFHRIFRVGTIYFVSFKFGTDITLIFTKFLRGTININDVKYIYFLHLSRLDGRDGGVIIYKTQNKFNCAIKLDGKFKIYEGKNWYEMWNKLNKDEIIYILSKKMSTEFFVEYLNKMLN